MKYHNLNTTKTRFLRTSKGFSSKRKGSAGKKKFKVRAKSLGRKVRRRLRVKWFD
jgi:hypothetical protein